MKYPYFCNEFLSACRGRHVPYFVVSLAGCMIDKAVVEQYINEKIAGTDFFIVALDVDASNNISVSLDSDTSITIDDCVDVSHYVEQKLNTQDENFSLQVATPGVNNPLVLPRQYVKNIGRQVKIQTKADESYKGELVDADNESFTIAFTKKVKQEGTKKKKKRTQHQSFSYDDIKTTKVVVSFK